MAFKMKGSPMQRNFGIGSPAKMTGDPEKEMTQEEKDAAIANAIPAAEKKVFSRETMDDAKNRGYMKKDGTFNYEKAKIDIGRYKTYGTEIADKRAAEIRGLMTKFR